MDLSNMTQRSTEWRQARLGSVTASRFADVLTSPSAKGVFDIGGCRHAWRVVCEGKTVSGDFDIQADAKERKDELVAEWAKTHWSQTALSYVSEKMDELFGRQPGDTWQSDATDWGTVNEPYAFEAAVAAVEEWCGKRLELPEGDFAYIEHPAEKFIGCSPDGIIGDDGTAELKCPYNRAKWFTAEREGLTLPAENRAQVQGQLWVTGRKWCAFCYFNPRVAPYGINPLLWVRVERDDDYIDSILAPRVIAFRDYLRSEVERLCPTAPF